MKPTDLHGIFPPITTLRGRKVAYDQLAANIAKWNQTAQRLRSSDRTANTSTERRGKLNAVKTVIARCAGHEGHRRTGCESTADHPLPTRALGAHAALVVTYYYGGRMNEAASAFHGCCRPQRHPRHDLQRHQVHQHRQRGLATGSQPTSSASRTATAM
jgi:hypothetical protein